MIVYDHGKTTKLRPDTRESKHVVSECIRLLQNASGVVRRPATPEQVDQIKRGEYALELVYDSPVLMEMAKLSDHSFTFTRIFIPMSGQYATNVSTVFVDDDAVYDSLIYRSNASTAAMRSYIRSVVAQMKKRTYYPPF